MQTLGRTPRDASASFAARTRSIAEWSDASKVVLLSGLTIPFALGWVLRLMKVAGDPSASPHINRAFLPLQIRYQHARRAELEITSSTDPLTGLANRLVFFRRLDEEVSRAKRHGHALCLMMVDADHFKAINDTHGHLVGDEVLRRLGAALRDTVRIDDVAARYGDEEFAILLPHTTLEEATTVFSAPCARSSSTGRRRA